MLGLEKCHSHHYRFTIYNPDGTEATKCINGMRAIAHLLFQQAPGVPILTLETRVALSRQKEQHMGTSPYASLCGTEDTTHH